MKQKIITILFFSLEGLCSFLAWQALYQAVLVPGSSHFLLPGVFFSLLAVFLLVSVILFSITVFRVFAISIAVLPVFFFGLSVPSCIAAVLASLFFYRSLRIIDRELSEHLTVRFFSSARMGTFLLSLGFSLVIVAAYAAMISDVSAENLLPRLSFTDGTGKVLLQGVGKINKNLIPLVEDDLSVDEFLLGLMPKEVPGEMKDDSRSEDYDRLIGGEQDMSQEFQKILFLREGRNRITDMLGRDIKGNERATDVLSEIINAKMFGTFASVHAEGNSMNILRSVMALLLFLSLFSIGSVFGFLWAFCAWIVFWILQGGNILTIRHIPVEAEQVVLLD